MSIATTSLTNNYTNYYENYGEKARREEKVSDSWFSDWLNDKDKVCTDEADDGSISLGEAAKSFGKGLMGIVKGVINNPITSALVIGGGVLLTRGKGKALLPTLTAIGTTLGIGTIGYGGYKAATAKTDGEAKAAYESIGNGVFALGTSILGAKSSLDAAAKAGVESAKGSRYMNAAEATVQCFKSVPESLSVGVKGVGSNINSTAVTLGLKQAPVKTFVKTESTAKYGFEIKPGMEKEFTKLINEYQNDSWTSLGVKDMKKIIAGLEDLTVNGKMNVKGYSELAKTIGPDLPGSFWHEALRIYNKFGVNADVSATTTAASGYLRGVSTINGCSNSMRFNDNALKYAPLLGITESINS